MGPPWTIKSPHHGCVPRPLNRDVRRVFKVTVSCRGVPPEQGPQLAVDVAAGFAARPWHTSVRCRWLVDRLELEAENDFDSDGSALEDEFWDEVLANLGDGFERITFSIDSVSRTSAPASNDRLEKP